MAYLNSRTWYRLPVIKPNVKQRKSSRRNRAWHFCINIVIKCATCTVRDYSIVIVIIIHSTSEWLVLYRVPSSSTVDLCSQFNADNKLPVLWLNSFTPDEGALWHRNATHPVWTLNELWTNLHSVKSIYVGPTCVFRVWFIGRRWPRLVECNVTVWRNFNFKNFN